MICRRPYTQPQSPLCLSNGSRESIKSQVVPEALTASSTNPDCMPPRTNQIKVVAREAQIELWLATVQRELLEGLRIRNDAVAIVMEGRGSDTRGKCGLRAEKLWKLPLCGSRGKIKLQRQFFHCSHIAWKTLRKKQKRGEFPTVPTASAAGLISEEKPLSGAATCCVR